jgi:hypothetical protein
MIGTLLVVTVAFRRAKATIFEALAYLGVTLTLQGGTSKTHHTRNL